MKKLFILALFIFSLINLSYADSYTVNVPDTHGGYTPVVLQSSGSGYTGPDGEYYANFPTVDQLQLKYGVHNAAEQQQLIAQQIQKSDQEMADRQKQWQEEAKKQHDEAIFKSEHPFGIPTSAQAKKNAMDWFIANIFLWTLLLLALGALVFILLLHLPNRLIGPDHPVHDLPLAAAVRRGMTKAKFNENVAGLLYSEVLVIAIFVGVGFRSFLAFIIAGLVGIVLMNIRTSAFVLMYLFSTFWMLVAAQFGYLLCGGPFITIGNEVSAWIGGFIVALLAFSCAFGVHTAGLQYYEDIGSG